ncbi:MAG TPA: ABC transporter substrate-binding protein [Alphaproteobacteria bacterium]|nr:ABC transporter substrate-binding protein [Alphaproteobacteria bacterium]
MSRNLKRRLFLAGAAVAAAFPFAPAIAESKPARIGLLTVKTGPLAQGGIQMEQGLTAFLKEKNGQLAGRKVELISADTGGNPAGAKTKAQELVERDAVDFIVGPLAAFELLAITDYIAQAKVPMLSLAAADDMTQRKPNPWFIRASATSSQCNHPLGDYAAKEMKLKRVMTICEDFAFGYEQAGGFQRTFEDAGGKVAKRLWVPIVTPDYTPYLAQISDVDAVWQGFAGSNPVKFMRQYADYGLKSKYPLLGGWTALDDALLKSLGDEAVGAVSAAFYSSEFNSPSNKRFVAAMVRETENLPGGYAAGCYINGMCIEAALEKTGGATDDKGKTIAALRAVKLADSPRGAFHFDHFGNVVGNVFIRKLERKDGKLTNTIIKTYPDVGQFWTYDEAKYLAAPVYTRDAEPAKL